MQGSTFSITCLPGAGKSWAREIQYAAARGAGINLSLWETNFHIFGPWQLFRDIVQVNFVFGQVKVEDHLPGAGNTKTLMLSAAMNDKY